MEKWLIKTTTKKGSLGASAFSASEAAIRQAEIFGTKLVIKENGFIKEVSPRQMKLRLSKLKA